jgi:hypothetical protein
VRSEGVGRGDHKEIINQNCACTRLIADDLHGSVAITRIAWRQKWVSTNDIR